MMTKKSGPLCSGGLRNGLGFNRPTSNQQRQLARQLGQLASRSFCCGDCTCDERLRRTGRKNRPHQVQALSHTQRIPIVRMRFQKGSDGKQATIEGIAPLLRRLRDPAPFQVDSELRIEFGLVFLDVSTLN